MLKRAIEHLMPTVVQISLFIATDLKICMFGRILIQLILYEVPKQFFLLNLRESDDYWLFA